MRSSIKLSVIVTLLLDKNRDKIQTNFKYIMTIY